MFTGARLLAAVCLGLASAAMYFVLLTQYPDEKFYLRQNEFLGMLAGVGVLVGWKILGVRAADEKGIGIFLGLRAAITVMFAALFLAALRTTIIGMLGHAYWEPMEAILDLLGKLFDYSAFLLNQRVLGFAAVLGISVGVITRWAAQNWK